MWETYGGFRIKLMAEGEGFEPPVTCATTVFKTAALNRSANPPLSIVRGLTRTPGIARNKPIGLTRARHARRL